MNKNILISDANHGGLVLLDEYSKYTNNNLFFYDTYDKLTNKDKEELTKKYSVEFLSLKYIQKNIDNFITINPIHMKPLFNNNYTHHEFTGYLLNKHKEKYGWDFEIIEVTGVKGKTTTVNLIKEVLKGKNTLILSSHNLTYVDCFSKTTILDDSLSITPASIITAINIAKNHNLLDKIDYCIFEVSLGITSGCDIGILTNILENYPIADGSLNASEAKKSVFNSKTVICDQNSFDKYYSNINPKNIILVSLNNSKSNIYTKNIDYDIKNTSIEIVENNNQFNIVCFALRDFYVNNILFAVSVGLAVNMNIKEIISNLKDINNLPGRGSCKYIEDKIILEDINPGLNTTSIKKCIDNLNKYSDNYTLIIGGDYGITCEEIDEDKLINYIKTLEKNNIIFTGSVGESLVDKLNEKCIFFKTINDAFKSALSMHNDIIQILYRSEYNRKIKYLD